MYQHSLSRFAILLVTFCAMPLLLAQRVPTQELILPVIVNGCPDSSQTRCYEAALHVFAPSGPQNFDLQGYTNTTSISVACDLTPVSIVGSGGGVAGVPFFLNFPLCPWGFQNGWVRFTSYASTRATVAAELILRAGNSQLSDPILSATTVPAVPPARDFTAPVDSGFRMRSAYAIVNPSSSSAANVQIKAVDNEGNILCSTSLTLPAFTRVAKFYDELLSSCGLGRTPGRTLRLTSDVPIAVGALSVTPEGHFVALPVQFVE